MRFTFLSVAACIASALRPEKVSKMKTGVGSKTASIRDILSNVTKTKDLATLKKTTRAVGDILAEIEQFPGALDHMSENDQDVLHFAITTFETMIYTSLDDCHQENVVQLDDAIHAIEQCNVNIAFRQSPQGDLGKLETALSLKQIELNRLQGVVDVKTEINNTRWAEFNSHMQLIAKPPACPGLPARTMPALDLYFEESLYVIWFAAQQSAYVVVRDAWSLASANLESAIEAYEIQLAVRNTQYCDWRTELEAACAAFDLCYAETNAAYTTLAQEVTKMMDERISIKKSGDIIIHQLQFLLGEVGDQESPPEDTADYQIAFPAIPEAGVCDLTPLDADRWVPSVECSVGLFADGSLIRLDITPGTVEETDRVTDAQRCARNRGNGLVNCLSDSNIAAGAWNVVTLRVEDPTGAGDGRNVRLHHVNYGYCNIGVIGPRFGCNAVQADAASWTFEKSNKSPGSFNLFTNGYSAILSHDNYLIFQGFGQRPNRFVDFDIVQVTVSSPAPSPVSFAGTYEVWYRGQRRNGQVMRIGCDNSMNGHGGRSQLEFDGLGAICDMPEDSGATMFSVGLHGASKHECYSVDGDNIVGNHYVNGGRSGFWGRVEYRLTVRERCA